MKLGAALGDSWGKLVTTGRKAWESIAASIGEALGPSLTEKTLMLQGLADGIKDAAKATGEWIRNNQGFVVGLFAVGGAVAALGAGVASLGVGLTVFGSLAATVGTIGAVITNPLVLAGAAIAAAGVYWAKYTESGKASMKSFMDTIRPFVTIAVDTIKGIQDAFVGGDLNLAWDIAMAGLKLAALQTFESIRGIIGDNLADAGQMILNGEFTGVWDKVCEGISDVWHNFSTYVVESMAWAVDQVRKMWAKTSQWVAERILLVQAAGQATGLLPGNLKNFKKQWDALQDMGKDEQRQIASTSLERYVKRNVTQTEDENGNSLVKKRGARGESDAVRDARNRLKGLTDRAAEKAEAKRKEGVIAEPQGESKIAAAKSFVTYSASAAIAYGFGGGKVEKEQAAKRQIKLQENAEKILQKQEQHLANLERSIVGIGQALRH